MASGGESPLKSGMDGEAFEELMKERTRVSAHSFCLHDDPCVLCTTNVRASLVDDAITDDQHRHIQ